MIMTGYRNVRNKHANSYAGGGDGDDVFRI